MTTDDTSYYLRDYRQFNNHLDPYKYWNTFKFLKIGINERLKNYDQDEVLQILEERKNNINH